MRRIKSLESLRRDDSTDRGKPSGLGILRRNASCPFDIPNRSGTEGRNSWKELKAVRFAFDKDDDCWIKNEMYIRIARRPFAEGSFRYCYEMQILHQDGRVEEMVTTMLSVFGPNRLFQVAKRCKKDVDPSVYFNSVMNQVSVTMLDEPHC